MPDAALTAIMVLEIMVLEIMVLEIMVLSNYSAVIARSAFCDEAISAAISEQGCPCRRLLRKKRSQ